jgi:hypothetical protein
VFSGFFGLKTFNTRKVSKTLRALCYLGVKMILQGNLRLIARVLTCTPLCSIAIDYAGGKGLLEIDYIE